jgi:hypothetical protein
MLARFGKLVDNNAFAMLAGACIAPDSGARQDRFIATPVVSKPTPNFRTVGIVMRVNTVIHLFSKRLFFHAQLASS